MILEWITSIDLFSLVLGTAVSTLVGTWYNYYCQRPKLTISGSGSSGTSDFSYTNIQLMNTPGLLGIRFPETMILGWYLHGNKEFGLVVERRPARECRAWMRDKQTNEYLGMMWWRGPDLKLSQVVTLYSGQHADLMLFVHPTHVPARYFLYQPSGSEDSTPKLSDDQIKLGDSRDFVIEVTHSYNKKRMRIGCKITKGLDGRFRCVTDGVGAGTF